MFSKIITILICLISILVSGCTQNNIKKSSDDAKLRIVCTAFPQYDWARELTAGLESQVEIILLTDNGADIHNFQPSADDIINISSADLVIYIGGESDKWVEEAIVPTQRKINMLSSIGDDIKKEAYVGIVENNSRHTPQADEHVWLSLENAEEICDEISEALSAIDRKNKTIYEKNEDIYSDKLEALDESFERAVKAAAYKTIVFGDRFPFIYMLDDYDISYFAAFPGCSAESEASFETIAFLSDKLNALKLPAIAVIEGSDKRIAETIIANTDTKNQKIVSFNSLQSITQADIDAGVDYLSVMEKNLLALNEALN